MNARNREGSCRARTCGFLHIILLNKLVIILCQESFYGALAHPRFPFQAVVARARAVSPELKAVSSFYLVRLFLCFCGTLNFYWYVNAMYIVLSPWCMTRFLFCNYVLVLYIYVFIYVYEWSHIYCEVLGWFSVRSII